MIGAAAHYRLLSEGPTALDFDVEPSLALQVKRLRPTVEPNGSQRSVPPLPASISARSPS